MNIPPAIHIRTTSDKRWLALPTELLSLCACDELWDLLQCLGRATAAWTTVTNILTNSEKHKTARGPFQVCKHWNKSIGKTHTQELNSPLPKLSLSLSRARAQKLSKKSHASNTSFTNFESQPATVRAWIHAAFTATTCYTLSWNHSPTITRNLPDKKRNWITHDQEECPGFGEPLKAGHHFNVREANRSSKRASCRHCGTDMPMLPNSPRHLMGCKSSELDGTWYKLGISSCLGYRQTVSNLDIPEHNRTCPDVLVRGHFGNEKLSERISQTTRARCMESQRAGSASSARRNLTHSKRKSTRNLASLSRVPIPTNISALTN